MSWVGPAIKRYFRAEVHGLGSIPAAGGAMVVSNHSGGILSPDVLLFAPAFFSHFGFVRPYYTLAHARVRIGPLGDLLRRTGVIAADSPDAAEALRSGAVVLIFPGGEYDSYRPTMDANVVDFNGQKGYVRLAVDAGVPIVPMVSIGAQETQLFLTRGDSWARRLGLDRAKITMLPVSIGFPFGISVLMPPNLPLPAKIVTRVLDPVDVVEEFGADPDVEAVDSHVRAIMQSALDDLANRRRFPVLG